MLNVFGKFCEAASGSAMNIKREFSIAATEMTSAASSMNAAPIVSGPSR